VLICLAAMMAGAGLAFPYVSASAESLFGQSEDPIFPAPARTLPPTGLPPAGVPPGASPPTGLQPKGLPPATTPQSVRILVATPIPIVLNGRVSGSTVLSPGATVKVLRVMGAKLEIEFLRARHLIPVAATDHPQQLPQAQVSSTSSPANTTPGNTSSNASAKPTPGTGSSGEIIPASNNATTTSIPAVNSTNTAAPGAPAPAANIDKLIHVEIQRSSDRNIEGGDYDDKIDRITLRVNLTNTSPTVPTDKLSGKIYVFAESILSRGLHKLLAAESFDFSLAPREKHVFETQEAQSGFDTTGARWGYKYSGWILALYNGDGKLVLVKSTSPTWQKNADQLSGLAPQKVYNRDLQERPGPQASR
jgi:hypothetical protein